MVTPDHLITVSEPHSGKDYGSSHERKLLRIDRGFSWMVEQQCQKERLQD
jgi:hypothetical protein